MTYPSTFPATADVFPTNRVSRQSVSSDDVNGLFDAVNKIESYLRADTFVDIRWFPVVGDGVANDTAAVQSALDTCNAVSARNGARGSTLMVPPGWTFKVGQLNWYDKVSLWGSGRGTSTFKSAGGGATRIFNIPANATNILIRDVTLDAASVAGFCVVMGASCADVIFERCTFTSPTSIHALTGATSGRVRFIRCNVLGFAANGVGLDLFAGAGAYNCYLAPQAANSIGIFVRGSDVSVIDNELDGGANVGKQGIYVNSADGIFRVDVFDNRIKGFQYEGIVLATTSVPCGDFRVKRNRITSCGNGTGGVFAAAISAYAPTVTTAVGLEIEDNTASGCGSGCFVSDTAGTTPRWRRVKVNRNIFTGMLGNGVLGWGTGMDVGGETMEVLDNICEANSHHGMYLCGHRLVVDGNHCNGNGTGNSAASGINSVADLVVMGDNICLGNPHSGIRVIGGASTQDSNPVDYTITGNLCGPDGVTTPLYGIAVTDTNGKVADHLKIVENDLRGNATAGYLFSGTGTSIEVRRNKGYRTEATGTATLVNGTTSIAVTHGLVAAPTRVRFTPTADTLGKRLWVSSKTTGGNTQFTVSADSAPGSDITFDWAAQVGEDL
jgi:hypothetical protein